MRQSPTLPEIAESFALWGEYFDRAALDTRESFDARPIADRLDMLRYAYGADMDEQEEEELSDA